MKKEGYWLTCELCGREAFVESGLKSDWWELEMVPFRHSMDDKNHVILCSECQNKVAVALAEMKKWGDEYGR